MVTLDLSFISVLKVMPAVAAVMAPGARMVVLIKPQFEAGRAQVGAGGLVKDPQASAILVPVQGADRTSTAAGTPYCYATS